MAKSVLPWWDTDKLEVHWRKRLTEDPGCWEDLLNDPKPECNDYRQRSFDVAERQNAWYVYRGKEGYHPYSTYYVDKQLVKVVVAKSTKPLLGERILTCYHEHWPHRSHEDVMSWPVGERKNRYRNKLEDRKKSELIELLKVIKDA